MKNIKQNNKELYAWQEVPCVQTLNGIDLSITLYNEYPTFGREHVLLPTCWCQPLILDGCIVSHNILH